MGSTQNVGVSVSGGRVPEEYDSSPMLLHVHTTRSASCPSIPWWNGISRDDMTRLQLEMRICAGDLAPDELLDFDVVLGHQVDRVLLLADAACARALYRVRAFEHERARFARKLGREAEDRL